MLGTAWNGYVNRCARISLRHFARVHNIPYATWQRELRRGAAEAKEPGHWEMDMVISRKGSDGGLLVMLDRCSRRYVIEHLSHINQDEVVTAIKRMKRRKALMTARSVTTDNECESLDQEKTAQTQSTENHSTEKQPMFAIHVFPMRLKDFLPTHPLYKSPWKQHHTPLAENLMIQLIVLFD